jgi:hypothetical protein
MKKLETFYYIDDKQIKMYLDQIPKSKKKQKKIKNTIGLGITGPKIDMTIEEEQKILTLFEQIKLLEIELLDNDLMTFARPESIYAPFKKPLQFIYEKTTATKLIFPKEVTNKLNGLNHLAVWISDPSPNSLIKLEKGWECSGTFLYLLETIGDSGVYQLQHSGVTALLALSNTILGYNFFDTALNKNGEETFGRSNFIHPVEKLKSIGAIIIDEREIETLYRCRYVSNEQAYTYLGTKHLVHDLLAYPIYIKEPNF